VVRFFDVKKKEQKNQDKKIACLKSDLKSNTLAKII